MAETPGTDRIAHRFAAPFRAACGATPPMTTAPDEAKVNCPECKAQPEDPGAFAAHDQLRSMIREATSGPRNRPGQSTLPESQATS